MVTYFRLVCDRLQSADGEISGEPRIIYIPSIIAVAVSSYVSYAVYKGVLLMTSHIT